MSKRFVCSTSSGKSISSVEISGNSKSFSALSASVSLFCSSVVSSNAVSGVPKSFKSKSSNLKSSSFKAGISTASVPFESPVKSVPVFSKLPPSVSGISWASITVKSESDSSCASDSVTSDTCVSDFFPVSGSSTSAVSISFSSSLMLSFIVGSCLGCGMRFSMSSVSTYSGSSALSASFLYKCTLTVV